MATPKPRSVLLQVRVDPRLHVELAKRAKRDSRTVASLVRAIITTEMHEHRTRAR